MGLEDDLELTPNKPVVSKKRESPARDVIRIKKGSQRALMEELAEEISRSSFFHSAMSSRRLLVHAGEEEDDDRDNWSDGEIMDDEYGETNGVWEEPFKVIVQVFSENELEWSSHRLTEELRAHLSCQLQRRPVLHMYLQHTDTVLDLKSRIAQELNPKLVLQDEMETRSGHRLCRLKPENLRLICMGEKLSDDSKLGKLDCKESTFLLCFPTQWQGDKISFMLGLRGSNPSGGALKSRSANSTPSTSSLASAVTAPFVPDLSSLLRVPPPITESAPVPAAAPPPAPLPPPPARSTSQSGARSSSTNMASSMPNTTAPLASNAPAVSLPYSFARSPDSSALPAPISGRRELAGRRLLEQSKLEEESASRQEQKRQGFLMHKTQEEGSPSKASQPLAAAGSPEVARIRMHGTVPTAAPPPQQAAPSRSPSKLKPNNKRKPAPASKKKKRTITLGSILRSLRGRRDRPIPLVDARPPPDESPYPSPPHTPSIKRKQQRHDAGRKQQSRIEEESLPARKVPPPPTSPPSLDRSPVPPPPPEAPDAAALPEGDNWVDASLSSISPTAAVRHHTPQPLELSHSELMEASPSEPPLHHPHLLNVSDATPPREGEPLPPPAAAAAGPATKTKRAILVGAERSAVCFSGPSFSPPQEGKQQAHEDPGFDAVAEEDSRYLMDEHKHRARDGHTSGHVFASAQPMPAEHDHNADTSMDPAVEVRLLQDIELRFAAELELHPQERTLFYCGIVYLLQEQFQQERSQRRRKEELRQKQQARRTEGKQGRMNLMDTVTDQEEGEGSEGEDWRDITERNFFELVHYGSQYLAKQEQLIWECLSERMVKAAISGYHDYPEMRQRIQHAVLHTEQNHGAAWLFKRGLCEAVLFDTVVRSRYLTEKLQLGNGVSFCFTECPHSLLIVVANLERCKLLLPINNSEVASLRDDIFAVKADGKDELVKVLHAVTELIQVVPALAGAVQSAIQALRLALPEVVAQYPDPSILLRRKAEEAAGRKPEQDAKEGKRSPEEAALESERARHEADWQRAVHDAAQARQTPHAQTRQTLASNQPEPPSTEREHQEKEQAVEAGKQKRLNQNEEVEEKKEKTEKPAEARRQKQTVESEGAVRKQTKKKKQAAEEEVDAEPGKKKKREEKRKRRDADKSKSQSTDTSLAVPGSSKAANEFTTPPKPSTAENAQSKLKVEDGLKVLDVTNREQAKTSRASKKPARGDKGKDTEGGEKIDNRGDKGKDVENMEVWKCRACGGNNRHNHSACCDFCKGQRDPVPRPKSRPPTRRRARSLKGSRGA
eukprot:g75104.t1